MGIDATDKLVLERIDTAFEHVPVPAEKQDRYQKLHEAAREMARGIVDLCQDSMERSSALQALEQSILWTDAALRRAA